MKKLFFAIAIFATFFINVANAQITKLPAGATKPQRINNAPDLTNICVFSELKITNIEVMEEGATPKTTRTRMWIDVTNTGLADANYVSLKTVLEMNNNGQTYDYIPLEIVSKNAKVEVKGLIRISNIPAKSTIRIDLYGDRIINPTTNVRTEYRVNGIIDFNNDVKECDENNNQFSTRYFSFNL